MERSVLLFALFCTLAAAGPVTMQRYLFPDAAQTLAVCNDGFYFRFANKDKWIIHLQGGGWCFDVPSCIGRMQSNPGLMSSKVWAPTFKPSGLFDQDKNLNPDWHDASYVYLPYCSSDSFSADTAPSNATGNWHFRGKRIITHAVQSVLAQGLATARNVLLSGCSAGGAAVIANADYVASLLPPLSPPRNYRAHSDGGWFLDANPMIPVPITMQGIFQKGVPFWGNSQPNAGCVAVYPTAIWRCYMGQYARPFIKTPHLVHMETEDFVQLRVNGVTNVQTTQEQIYLNNWRVNVTQTLAAHVAPSAVFAPACFWHCSTESSHFWTIKINNAVSDRDALHAWFFAGVTANWIDGCGGFSCSTNCPPPPAQLQTRELKTEQDVLELYAQENGPHE